MSETDFIKKNSCQGLPAMHLNEVNGLLGNILSKLKAAQTSGELRKYQLSSYQAAEMLNLLSN